jgi:hypothetical protein
MLNPLPSYSQKPPAGSRFMKAHGDSTYLQSETS